MLVVIASIALGVVFLVAGGSKIAAGRTWLQQASDLGAPRAIAPLVPWWEIAVGALLVVQSGRPWPAVAGLVSLLAFTALLIVRLRAGDRPPCACFGAWSASPIGWSDVARNAAFAAIAVVAIAGS